MRTSQTAIREAHAPSRLPDIPWSHVIPPGTGVTVDGRARDIIGRDIVRLCSEYYGRGPTRSRTYSTGDVVVVVLEETFTPAEKTLIERGEAESILDIRRRFQRAMADDFTAIVERATGREVRSFLSETDLGNDISVELFILAPLPSEGDPDEQAQDPAAP
jgi:uncharacterized protein YbcI